MKNKVVSTLVLLLFLSTLLLVYAQQITEMQQARNDAERDADDNVSMLAWGAGGFTCGFCAPLYALITKPEVPAGRFIGKSPEYVNTYTLVYQQRAKNRRIQASVIGCGISSAVSTASYYLFVLPQLDTLTY